MSKCNMVMTEKILFLSVLLILIVSDDPFEERIFKTFIGKILSKLIFVKI